MPLNISTTKIEIDGTTKLYIKDGNEAAGRILTSGSNGLVRWTDPKTLFKTGRYIGELYGGGIVVDIWYEGQDEKVLIASLTDVQIPYSADGTVPDDAFDNNPKWSFNDTSLAGATSLYNGKSNTNLITTNVNSNVNNLGFLTFVIARTSGRWSTKAADGGYSETLLNGYGDWYLPSLNEMKSIYQSAGIINRVLGEDNFKVGSRQTGANAKYWTSTEISASNAWLLNLTTGFFENTVKTTTARVRYVRMESKLVGNGLVFSIDMSNKKSYNDLIRSNKVGDVVNAGATSSYAFQFQSTNAVGLTYSTENDGYLSFFGNQYIDFSAPIGTTNTLTVEIWARLKPGSTGKMIFGWNGYTVYLLSGTLGYNTNNTDSYGISATQVTTLGLFDRWAHYVFEMRTDVSYTNNKIYIDGQEQTLSQQLGTEDPTKRIFNSGNGRIGTHRLNTNYLNPMDLAVFRIYNRSLTADEILKNYNSQKRKFDIGITNTHTIDPLSLSVSQNLSLNITGKRNDKILRTDSSGNTSWVDKRYLFNKSDNDLNVGDIFGGGIIVSKWKYPSNVNRYLIMSTVDISAGSVWSNLSSDTSNTAGSINTIFDTSSSNWNVSSISVETIKAQTDGKVLISGNFTTYKDVSRSRFARLNSDGSLDTTFTCGFDDVAYSIELQDDGKILVGGAFSNYYATPGGTAIPANKIIRLNADGSIDTSFWAGNSSGANFGVPSGSVFDIQIISDGILVGGSLSQYTYNSASSLAPGIIKLNFDGTRNSTFTNNLGTGASPTVVNTIAVQSDNKIILGGEFISFNGTSKNRILRLNSNGTLDGTFTGSVSFGSDPSCAVRSISIQTDGKIIIGGRFSSPASYIARLTTTGANDTTFSASTNDTVNSVLVYSGRIIIAGVFTLCNGSSATGLAVLQSTGTRDTSMPTISWNPSAFAYCRVLATHTNGSVMVGGFFNRVNTSIVSSGLFGFYPVSISISNDMPTGLTNDYNGATNSQNIISRPNHTTSAAKLCDDYTGGGFTDWYLPALFELSQAYNSLSSTGYVLGKAFSGTYWSSTNTNGDFSYYAYAFNIDSSGSTGTQIRTSMSTSYKVRAFRQVAQLSNIQTWNKPNPWDDPDLSWENTPGSNIWSTYSGVTTRNLIFHFNTNNKLSYKGTGTVGYNLINNTSGTLLSGVTFSSNAILFNGTMSTTNFNADSYIDFGTSTTTNVSNSYPYTIESWFNPSFGTASVNTSRGILAVGVSTTLNSNYSGIDMVIIRNPNDTDTYKVVVNLGDNVGSSSGNRKSINTTNYIIQKGQWYHICVVINSINSFNFYINGTLYTNLTIDGTATSLAVPIGSKILIGQSSVYKRVFGGFISICRFYNTALTTNEVKENFEFDRIKYGR
jgi:uncharacterized delta-60 repeat protein